VSSRTPCVSFNESEKKPLHRIVCDVLPLPIRFPVTKLAAFAAIRIKRPGAGEGEKRHRIYARIKLKEEC